MSNASSNEVDSKDSLVVENVLRKYVEKEDSKDFLVVESVLRKYVEKDDYPTV